jgi:hypothetical protein
MLGQWNACIKREQTWSILVLCIWIFLIIQGKRFVHNGLVGGSSFSLTGEAKMPTQRQMLMALDAALSAQVNLLFSKMASALEPIPKVGLRRE